MCTVLLPPGGYPTAVNKYIMYHTEDGHSVIPLNVSSNSKYTLENANCVLLLVHQTTTALNKLKFMKYIYLLRVNCSHKLYLISAFVG
jgi:hypothetical protein